MKKIALFGAGQIGAAVLRLLGSSYAACCFADNAEEKWGGNLAGIPIVSPQESLLFSPDCFVLCVLDEERSSQMRATDRPRVFRRGAHAGGSEDL